MRSPEETEWYLMEREHAQELSAGTHIPHKTASTETNVCEPSQDNIICFILNLGAGKAAKSTTAWSST